MLEAGQLHNAHDVVIPWPLKLIGSGADAEDTVLLCPKGPDAALDFRYGSLLALECHSVLYVTNQQHEDTCVDVLPGLHSVFCCTEAPCSITILFSDLESTAPGTQKGDLLLY